MKNKNLKSLWRMVLTSLVALQVAGCNLLSGNDDDDQTVALGLLALASSCPTVQMGGARQGCALNLSGTVTTFAGGGSSGSADGIGTAASFNSPYGITTDGTHLYVADTFNHLIRRVNIATGEVTTLAGTGSTGSANGTGTAASFNQPTGITTDGTNLFVGDTQNHLIRKIVIATGEVTTFAGSGSSGSADGVGTAASFSFLRGVTTDGTNLYVADTSNRIIRKVEISTANVTTLAGSGSAGLSDGTGTAATFTEPIEIATDGTNLYVPESASEVIRQIVISTGQVTTIAGSGTTGGTDGTGTSATFDGPIGVVTDGTNLYITDAVGDLLRQLVLSSAVVTTIAGTGSNGSADGIGTSAAFSGPYRITTDGTSLFLVDSSNNAIRKID